MDISWEVGSRIAKTEDKDFVANLFFNKNMFQLIMFAL
jgi:hypothetical protein